MHVCVFFNIPSVFKHRSTTRIYIFFAIFLISNVYFLNNSVISLYGRCVNHDYIIRQPGFGRSKSICYCNPCGAHGLYTCYAQFSKNRRDMLSEYEKGCNRKLFTQKDIGMNIVFYRYVRGSFVLCVRVFGEKISGKNHGQRAFHSSVFSNARVIFIRIFVRYCRRRRVRHACTCVSK